MRGRWAAAVGLLLAAVAGCAPVGVVPPPPDAPQRLEKPGSLLALARERRGDFQDLRGLVEITLQSPREHYTGKAVLLLQKEGSIRLEPLSFFGQPVFYLVAHGGRLEAYAPEEGNYFRGRATAQNLYQWMGIPLTPREVVSLLWGGIPAPDRGTRLRAEWDGSVGTTGAYRLESIREERVSRRWWVDARSFLPLRLQAMDGRGQVLLTARYENYHRESGVLLPGGVEVEVGPSERTLGLRYGRMTVNRGLGPLSFHLPVPQGAQIIHLDR